ncbi:MAG TPA: response regulator [Gemmataceae bacterium]|nr:response regulator [Gemmataceae bacterium]
MNSQPGTGRSILLVEDDELIRRAMKMVLEWEGYQVSWASNGQEALDYLRAGNHPCLIVLDVMMPVLDGEQFRREQARDPNLASIPVIVVSAAAFAESVSAAQHIRKPFEVQELLEAIHQQISPAVGARSVSEG